MTRFTRRGFIAAGCAPLALAACGNGVNSRGSQKIDARVDSALAYLRNNVPGAMELENKAAGVLVIPLISKVGFGLGASYGRGALRINDATVDYYSTANASIGLQIGAQQYAHALYFMTDDALNDFRRASGWAAGADLEYAISSNGGSVNAETTTALNPVVAIVFGQAGLIAGASLEGLKYSRIIP
jgi:lipid-binding SYLF domain-containing protein